MQACIGLTWKIAWGFRNYGFPVEDLAQEGQLGAIKDLAKYDPARARLYTYAAWWIRAYILTYVLKNCKIVGSCRANVCDSLKHAPKPNSARISRPLTVKTL
ncbi:MAG: RNA polymerase sigma factor [Parcubacteria group bacterium GW2011_GWA2_47_26]|nr:MAG: RNA polymerase sigma factor [Parcubacteria group bacterium GW2011_GWA2_47_26]